MIFTDAPEINPTLSLEDLPGTFGQGVAGSVVQALRDSPVAQIYRSYEDFSAGGPTIDYETARSRAKEAGVDIRIDPKGIGEDALNLLIKRKREQAQIRDLVSRAPSGAAATASYFLAGLGASMLDPLNVALSFIPVARGVGMAETAAKAGILGAEGAALTAGARAAARVRVGAVEGAVGQAIVEPLTAYRARQEQEDYGITDSLLNIGFGAVLGAVAHTGLGALGDRGAAALRETQGRALIDAAKAPDAAALKVKGADLETVSAQFRAEVVAAADGRKMDTETMLPQHAAAEPMPRVMYHGSRAEFDQFDPTLGSTPGAWFTSDRAAAEVFGNVRAVTLDIKNPATMAEFADARRMVAAAGGEPNTPEFNRAVIEELTRRGFDGIHDSKFQGAGGNGGEVWAAFRPEQIKTAPESIPAPKRPIDPAKVQEAAAKSHLAENDVHYDAAAKAEVDEAVKLNAEADPEQAVTRAIQEAQTELQTLSKQLGIDPEKNAAMKAADETAGLANKYSRAVEALATCQART